MILPHAVNFAITKSIHIAVTNTAIHEGKTSGIKQNKCVHTPGKVS